MQLRQFKALTFDVYGTLIDWESGMIAGLASLSSRVGRSMSRDEILEAHAHYEATQQRWTPARRYSELLASVYRRLAEEWGVEVDWQECLAYGRTVKDWPAFPDSADALSYLKAHYKLIVLTNTDNESFQQSALKLGAPFDGAYTAEDIGSYKPAPRNFEYMIDMLARRGIARDEILHTAESLFHDLAPANAFGLANCWIHRRHGQQGFGATMPPAEMPRFDFHFTSMADLVRAHRAEAAG